MSANDFELIKNKAQKDKEKAEQQKLLLLKQVEETKQLQYCEANTPYASTLNIVFQNSPANFNFATIRSICTNCGVWNELDSGVAILTSYEQLSQYIFSYGNMHQSKLLQAFQVANLQLEGQKIEIIDYGCGQGIGTVVLFDHFKQNTNFNFTIEKVKLIEPSEYKQQCDQALLELNTDDFTKLSKWTKEYELLGSQNLLMFEIYYIDWDEDVSSDKIKIYKGLYTERKPFANILCFCKVFQHLYWDNCIHETELIENEKLEVITKLKTILKTY